jgi:hypothetical protein
MKQTEKPTRLEDVELVPDAMERLEGAIKHAARKPAEMGGRRVAPTKPRRRPVIRRP